MPGTLLRYLRGAPPRPNAAPFALLDPTSWVAARAHEWAAAWAADLRGLGRRDLLALGAAAIEFAAPHLGPSGAAAWRAWRRGDEADDAWVDEPVTFAAPRRWGGPEARWSLARAEGVLLLLRSLSRAAPGGREAALTAVLKLAVRGVAPADGPEPLGGRVASALGAASAFLIPAASAALRGFPLPDPLPGHVTAPGADAITRALAVPAATGGWSVAAAGGVAPSGGPLRAAAEAVATLDPAWGAALALPTRWAATGVREDAEWAAGVLAALAASGVPTALAAVARDVALLSLAWNDVFPLAWEESVLVASAMFGAERVADERVQLGGLYRAALARLLISLAALAAARGQADPRGWALGAAGLPAAPRAPQAFASGAPS